MPTTRRQAIADEIGSANVIIAADAYWQGWRDAMLAARAALQGDPFHQRRCAPVTADVAMMLWLDGPVDRLQFLCPTLSGQEERHLP